MNTDVASGTTAPDAGRSMTVTEVHVHRDGKVSWQRSTTRFTCPLTDGELAEVRAEADAAAQAFSTSEDAGRRRPRRTRTR